MQNHALSATAALLLFAVTVSPAGAQQPAAEDEGLSPTAAAALEWAPIQPPGFDPGMEISVVNGDPAQAGEPYTIRLRFVDGYRFPPHWHPVDENLTVLEGTFLLAMGEEADEASLARYAPGDFLFIEARHPHYGGASGPTVIQLHGLGPFDIIVVGSEDDVR